MRYANGVAVAGVWQPGHGSHGVGHRLRTSLPSLLFGVSPVRKVEADRGGHEADPQKVEADRSEHEADLQQS